MRAFAFAGKVKQPSVRALHVVAASNVIYRRPLSANLRSAS
jgi:hypothetical protein